MPAPQWELKINPNTVLVLFSIASTLIGVGMVYQQVKGNQQASAETFSQMDKRIVKLESQVHDLIGLNYRLSNAERSLDLMSADLRIANKSLGDLSANIRVMQEILQRIESTQRKTAVEPGNVPG